MARSDETNEIEAILYLFGLILYSILAPPANMMDEFNEGNYGKSFMYLILTIIVWSIYGAIIYWIISLFIESRSCLDGEEKYIVQRDVNDFFTPEYTIYVNEAPAFNNNDEDYPPAVRVDTPVNDGANSVFFPTFEFKEPEFPSNYFEFNFENLRFERINSFQSLYFPSYRVFDRSGNQIATIGYPLTEEEGGDALGYLGIERKYVIDYKDQLYLTSEELRFEQVLEGEWVKTLNFYRFIEGDRNAEDNPIAKIKVRGNLLGRSGIYTICIGQDLDPVFKELIFASVIAFDQHVIADKRERDRPPPQII